MSPKTEIDYIFDMEDEAMAALHVFAKGVAGKVRAAISCKRIGVAVVGLEVPHVHIHLIPLDELSDTDFSKKRLRFSPEEFEAIAKSIRET